MCKMCKHTTWGEGFTLRATSFWHNGHPVYRCWICNRFFIHDAMGDVTEVETMGTLRTECAAMRVLRRTAAEIEQFQIPPAMRANYLYKRMTDAEEGTRSDADRAALAEVNKYLGVICPLIKRE